MSDSTLHRPLRILAIISLPWDPRLGAARVLTDLTEEWRTAGHQVEKFCLTDAYPSAPVSGRRSVLRFALFPARAAAFVRRNADRFDVIDALVGTLPFSAGSLGFRGLLVARSVGLHRLYDRFEVFSRRHWPVQRRSGFPGSLFYRMVMRRLRHNAEKAIQRCDLLNVPNESELSELRKDSALVTPALIQPYGLRESHRAALKRSGSSALERQRRKEVVFLGAWGLRKGSGDWATLVARIWEEMPEVRFKFLGTMVPTSRILSDLGLSGPRQIECISEFSPEDLPHHLKDATVALFPSYVEGFGIAVIEQLAAGIPTIAYDIPGPREILQLQRSHLLSPVGDVAALAERALRCLKMDAAPYATLSAECIALSARYRCAEIAAETAGRYAEECARLHEIHSSR